MKKFLHTSLFCAMFVFAGVGMAQAATTNTCYTTCSPVYANYVGTVILDLQCNGSSPASYTGSLTVNGVSLSYGKTCASIPPPPPPPPPPAPTFSCTGGNPPAGANWCSGDDTGLTASIGWQLVGYAATSCTNTRKCEYWTPPSSCSGSSGGNICSGDGTTVSGGIWHYVGSSASSCTSGECEYWTCSPDCSNVANICIGNSYGDGCGGACAGTKDCRNGGWMEESPN